MKYEESQFIYRQRTGACDEMLQGQDPGEERIPSVREFASSVEMNADTVVRTYDYLQGLEIIYNVEQIKTQAHYVY